MKFRPFAFLSLPAAIFAMAIVAGCNHQVVAASSGLSQAEAEKISSNIYIAGCHPPQPGLVRTVTLGTPNPHAFVYGSTASVMAYPIQVTWSGSCNGHPVNVGQTDFYDNVKAKYTANYYKDQFGNWTHTSYTGTCSRVHKAYQQNGGPMVPDPNTAPATCGLADSVND